ncbi:hypothetical protein C2G38_2206615 [Gigaspora rosea]|uniref:Uncharacterized protein n=1 Tax=Gigaspora rosea TaxID=44941 RepID=A0A397UM83_9GLOM|nr:hypothetical protein C2G38_2206615 [Gigaspora rosea]
MALVSKKLSQVNNKCIVGFCNNDKRLNICRQKREYGVIIDPEFDFSPHIKEIEDGEEKKQRTYFIPISTRMLYLRLFQKINTKQKNLELHDIVVQFKFTSVYNEDIQKRTQIPIFNEKTINITPLNIQFRNYIEPHLETEYTINCTGCEYQNHEVNLCLNLNKLKVCILENDDNNIKIFNEGNFALVVFVDYCNMFYKFKREKGDIDYLKFGENFSSTEGKLGIPLFFHGGSIETTWKQDFESSNVIDSIFGAFNKCCKK